MFDNKKGEVKKEETPKQVSKVEENDNDTETIDNGRTGKQEVLDGQLRKTESGSQIGGNRSTTDRVSSRQSDSTMETSAPQNGEEVQETRGSRNGSDNGDSEPRGSLDPTSERRNVRDGRKGRSSATSAPLEGINETQELVEGTSKVNRNYHIDDPDALLGGTPKERFLRNQKAIMAVKSIIEEERNATEEEKAVMAAYSGWGSFGQELFQGTWARPLPKAGWEKENEWLRETLGKEAWESAQRSIINAHYTDPITVKSMWDMVKRLGFKNGKILEPSMGVGNFFALMPANIMEHSNLTGIELDEITGRMAKELYPDANIQIKGFQDSKTAKGFYDLIIGNVPFDSHAPADKDYDKLNLTLHDYFIIKGLDQLRSGGLFATITSSGTMDKQTVGARKEMAKRAELVAAYRLPTGAFKQYAGTEVVTDILIFKKRQEELTDAEALKQDWINTVELNGVRINEYLNKNRYNILGEAKVVRNQYGNNSLAVVRMSNYQERLENLYKELPTGVYEKSNQTQHIKYISNHTTDQQNALVTNSDGGLYIVEGEFLKPLNDVKKYVVKNAKDVKKREQELKDFIALRQAYCKLLDAEYSDDEQIENYRKELNKLYDNFVKNYGSIRKSWAVNYLTKIDEPYSFALQALENDKGGKATILKERMVRSVKKAENPTISDAFVIARYESQDIDIPLIAQLAHTTEKAVVKELIKQNAIFKTPTGNYETTDKYLSGNVRVKLREAQDALSRGDKDMERNIEALKEVIPETIPYYNIETNLGAGWINKDYYKQFIGELLNIKDLKAIDLRQEGGSWRITIDDRYKYNPLANSLTVDKVPINVMVAHAFNRTKPNLTKADPLNPKNRIKDEQGIAEAQSKIESIIDKFDNWVWNNDERKIALEHDYNEVMNAIATPVYDGSFLQMAGMMLAKGNGEFSLRQHQMNAIYRGIVNKRGIYAHEVGTGKTYTMGGLAIESRRYGIAKKPILFAHNANSAQVAKEIQEMYPAAKILYIDNLDPATIKRKMYQIQNDDWDLVVVPHSQINKFALKQETLMDLAADDIRALEDAAIDAALNDNEKLSVEDMDELLAEQQNPNKDKSKKGSKIRSATAKRLVSMRNKTLIDIQKQANKATAKDTISFENLGVDMIIVDEAHIFKKPGIVTQMSMKGLDTSSSSAAFQLKCLTQFVQSINGGTGVHLFTGTPITNTLAEMYSMMRYVMPQEMRDANIYDFDRWFNVFAAETNDIEITNTGEYEPVRRLASFTNVAELRRMVGNIFDIVFADDMPEFEPRKTDTGKTLDSKNLTEAERDQLLNGRTENPKGRPYKKIINVEVPLGERQQDVLQTLIKYAKEFKDATPKERREMSQKGDPRAPILIETAANNAGMDVRLYDKNIPAENVSKETMCVQNVVEIYHSHPKAVQVIFMERGLSDTSTRVIARDEEGKATRGTVEVFNLGKDIVNELVKQGIPRDEIVIMSSNIEPAERAKLAEQLSKGEKRVVIGSTATLGTGVNMQGNLRAMHHLDAPWTPAALEQRNGRGQRQGNAWNTVLEFRYLTEKLDGKRWQVLSVKDRFIKMYLKADDSLRTIEGDAVDMNEGENGVTDLQETLSKATGDARILLREKYTSDIKNLEKKERLFITGIKELNTKIKQAKDFLVDFKNDLEIYKEAAKNYNKVKDDDFEIRLAKMRGVGKSQYISFDKFSEAKEHLESLVASMKRGEQMPIGVYKGFDLVLEKSTVSDNVHFIIKQGSFKEYTNGTIEGVRARLNSLDKLIEATKAKINDLEEQIPVMEKNAKAVFPQTDTLTAKRKMLADVIRDLRDNPVPPPAWLVQGAPVDTEVFYENEPYTVTGHKANNDGYYVSIADKEENSAVIPYQEAKDSQGMYLYDVEKYGESIPYRRQNSLFIYDSSDDDIIVRSIKPLGENETKVVEIAERYGGRKEENAFIFDDEGGRDSFFEEATDYLESSKAKSNVSKDKKFNLAESEEYIQSKEEIINDLVDIFGDDVKHEIQGNNILVTTDNGKRLLIRIEDEIIFNEEEIAQGKEAHNIDEDTDVEVSGYWQRLTKDDIADGEIVISAKGVKGTAYHEILHAVMDLALTAKEKRALIKDAMKEAKETGKDVEEVIAERYRKWVLARKRGQGTAWGKLFKKMQDFYYKLKALFTRIENAHNVMRKIESREVWTRDGRRVVGRKGKKFLVAYHGTPHDFDKFDSNKVGTGVGSQMHGWGLYFAEKEEVAKDYRDRQIEGDEKGRVFEVDIPENDVMLDENLSFAEQPTKVREALTKIFKDNERIISEDVIDDARKYLKVVEKQFRDNGFESDGIADSLEDSYSDLVKAIASGNKEEIESAKQSFNFELEVQIGYQVEAFGIEDNDYLAQEITESVIDYINLQLGKTNPVAFLKKLNGKEIYNTLSGYLASEKKASKLLDENGVKGIRFGDTTDRAYVVFDDSQIKVNRKYSVAPSKNPTKGIVVTTAPTSFTKELKEQGVKGYLKAMGKNFYRDWVDKNDSLHDLYVANAMALGRELKDDEKVYNRAQTMNATAAGRTQALIEGNEHHIKALSEQMGRPLHNVTLRGILEYISKGTMDKLYPNYLKDNGFKDWVEAFGNYLALRRLREMVKYSKEVFQEKHAEWANKKRIHDEWVRNGRQGKEPDRAGKEPVYKPYDLPKNADGKQITMQDVESVIRNAPKEFVKASEMYYKFNDNLLTILEDAGIISKEVHQLLNTKYKEYCPLMRDFSDTAGADMFLNGLTNGGRGIANVSSTLKRISLEGSERGVINPLETTIKSVAVMMNRAERNKVGQMAVKLAGEKGMENVIREVPTPNGGNAVADPKNSIFTVMINGKKVAYWCQPELYGAIVGYNVPTAGFVLGVARSTARMLRTGATISPSFIIRNLIRDTIFAAISSQNGFIPIVDSVRGAMALLHNPELKAQFETAGVTSFNFYSSADKAYKSLVELNGGKELNFKNPVDLVKALMKYPEEFSAFIESATRMGEFKRAIEAGKSVEEATRAARELTLDFSRSGVLGENVNLVVPFFNATIQGGDKLYRLFRDNPVGTAVNVAKYIVLPSMVLWAMNYDDEDYKELDPKIKLTHWVIGGVRIPKPQEAGVMFGSSVEALLDLAAGKDPDAMKNWARQVVDGALPNIIPTLLLPIIEWQANYSFFRDGKLVGYREEKLPDELQYKDSTSELSKGIGKLTGLSPIKIDNTVRGYTGTMGMLLWQAYDFGSMDKAKLPDKKLVELPLIRDFFINEYNTRRSVDEFYKLAEQADKQHAGYGVKGKPTAVVKGIRQAKQQISNLNKDIRKITDSGLSPAEKRIRIDKKREVIKRIAQRANDRYAKFYD